MLFKKYGTDIQATKALLRRLRSEGVIISRGNEPKKLLPRLGVRILKRQGEFLGGITAPRFRPKFLGGKSEIWIPRKSNMNPREVLFHETGHYIDTPSQRIKIKKIFRFAKGINRKSGESKKVFENRVQRLIIGHRERVADLRALDQIRKLTNPKNTKKSIRNYRKNVEIKGLTGFY